MLRFSSLQQRRGGARAEIIASGARLSSAKQPATTVPQLAHQLSHSQATAAYTALAVGPSPFICSSRRWCMATGLTGSAAPHACGDQCVPMWGDVAAFLSRVTRCGRVGEWGVLDAVAVVVSGIARRGACRRSASATATASDADRLVPHYRIAPRKVSPGRQFTGKNPPARRDILWSRRYFNYRRHINSVIISPWVDFS